MFIEKKDDGGGGDNWTTGAISRAKLQSNHHHQQTIETNIQFFTGRMPFLSPNSVKTAKGKISHSMDLLTPSSPGGLPTLSLTTNSSWLPWRRVVMPLISPLMPVPHSHKGIVNYKLRKMVWVCDLEVWVYVTQGHRKWHLLICELHASVCWRSIVTILWFLSRVVFDLQDNFCAKKNTILPPLPYLMPHKNFPTTYYL